MQRYGFITAGSLHPQFVHRNPGGADADDDKENTLELGDLTHFSDFIEKRRRQEIQIEVDLAECGAIIKAFVKSKYPDVHVDISEILDHDDIRHYWIMYDKLYKNSRMQLNDLYSKAIEYLMSMFRRVDAFVKYKMMDTAATPKSITNQTTYESDFEYSNVKSGPKHGIDDSEFVKFSNVKMQRKIQGTSILFPFESMAKPQLQLMVKLLQALSKGEHVILESPTGTGKTAAILSGILSFIHDQRTNSMNQNRFQNHVQSRTDRSSGVESNKSNNESEASAVQYRGNIRVLYFTRTHTQIRQVSAAISKSCFNIAAITLASRNQLCLIQQDKSCQNEMFDGGSQSSQIGTAEDSAYSSMASTPLDGADPQKETVNAMCRRLTGRAERSRFERNKNEDCCSGRVPLISLDKKSRMCRFYAGLECKDYSLKTMVRFTSDTNASWDIEDIIQFSRDPDTFAKASLGCKCFSFNPSKPKPKKSRTKPNTDILDFFTPSQHTELAATGTNASATSTNSVSGCPYYTARALSQIADFVTCPYAYVIDPKMVARGISVARYVHGKLLDSMAYEDNDKSDYIDLLMEKTELGLADVGSNTVNGGVGFFGSLANSILVFDEGHNLENACIEEASIQVSLDVLNGIVKWLQNLVISLVNADLSAKSASGDARTIHRLLKTVTKPVMRLTQFFETIVAKLKEFSKTLTFGPNDVLVHSWDRYNDNNIKTCMQGAQTFLDQFELELIDVYFSFLSLLQMASLGRLLADVNVKAVEPNRPELERLMAILVLLCFKPESFAVLMLQDPSTRSKLQLCIWLMDPSVVFDPLAASSMSIVIASGTLAPIPAMISNLGDEFASRLATNVLSTTNVLDQEQLAIYNLTKVTVGPCRNTQLVCTYKQINDHKFLISIGQILANLLEVLPGGTLVFFPNRQLVDRCLNAWSHEPYQSVGTFLGEGEAKEAHSIMDAIEYFKGKVILEPVHAPESMQIQKEVSQMNKYVVFAVYRSHFSEGINLSLTSLVLLGLPFPCITSPHVDISRRYHKARASSYNWLLRETYRAINQSIGRCIRTRNDKGVVILVDARYQQNQNYLSPWLLEHFRSTSSLESIKREVQLFDFN